MLIDSKKNQCFKRITDFNKLMIETSETGQAFFEYDGVKFYVYSDGICVQTLLNKRVLYRIFIDKSKNSEFFFNNFLKYFKN